MSNLSLRDLTKLLRVWAAAFRGVACALADPARTKKKGQSRERASARLLLRSVAIANFRARNHFIEANTYDRKEEGILNTLQHRRSSTSIPPYAFGSWDGKPLLRAPGEAWFYSKDERKWLRVDSTEAGFSSVLDELSFRRKFGRLPPLPPDAFLRNDPEEVENKIVLATRARGALAERGIGGYYNRDNPSFVFVYAIASALGGKFSAFRIDGRWKLPSGDVTFGDLEEDFLPILNVRDVEALLAAARRSLS